MLAGDKDRHLTRGRSELHVLSRTTIGALGTVPADIDTAQRVLPGASVSERSEVQTQYASLRDAACARESAAASLASWRSPLPARATCPARPAATPCARRRTTRASRSPPSAPANSSTSAIGTHPS